MNRTQMYYTEALPGYVSTLVKPEHLDYITSYYAEWHKQVGVLQTRFEQRAEPLECAEDCQCPDCQLGRGGGEAAAPIIFDLFDAADQAEVVQRTIYLRCDVSKAFGMFTRAEWVQSWLAPYAVIDLKDGGCFDLSYDGNRFMKQAIIAVEPDAYFSFEWAGMKNYSYTDAGVIAVSFEPSGAETRVQLTHSGWGDSETADWTRRWYETFWREALRRLEKQIEVMKPR